MSPSVAQKTVAEADQSTSALPLIQIGIVGCGEVTRAKHLPKLQMIKGVKVVVVADVDQARCREVATAFAIPLTCSTMEELLQTPGLDAVAICTPPATHADLVISALRAGKHVWVDFPLVLSEEDALRLVREATNASTVLMPGMHMRFHRLFSRARRVIQRGELGRIESARVIWHGPRSDQQIAAWKTCRASGGGSLVEIASHHLDLLRFLLDSEIAEIFAISNDDLREDENASISARMSNGVIVSGEFSERSPHEIQIVVSGSAAILTIDGLKFEGFYQRSIRQRPGSPNYRLRDLWNFLCRLPGGLNIMRGGGDYHLSYFHAWSAFVDAIRGSKALRPSIEDGLRTTQAVCAAIRSRELRTAVTIPAPQPSLAMTKSPVDEINQSAGPGTHPLIFSVIVPTYNRPDQIRGLLESLTLQRFPLNDFEVIIVDDGGLEPLDAVIGPLRDRLQIRLLRQPNGGCANARQAGIESAQGQFLAFTDDDCRPSPGWLESLLMALLRHPGSAIIGPTLNGLQKDLRAETTQLIVNWLVQSGADDEGGMSFGPTCNFAGPRATLLQVGGLEKTWRIAGGEDRDLCARWQEAGHTLHFATQAQVLHYHPLTTRQFLRQHFHYGRGARKFRRHLTAVNSRFRRHEKIVNYVQLSLLPWQNYDGTIAVKMAWYLMLAQLSTIAGMLSESCQFRRPSTAPSVLTGPANGEGERR